MTDILIVGAGPTGLALAHECTRHNLDFRIIEQKEGISVHSKALGIHARTLEVFELMGIVDPFLRLGKAVNTFTFHGKNQSIDFSFAKIETRYPYVLILSQSETERILKEQIEHRGKKIEWRTRLVEIEDNKATIEHYNGEREIVEAKWIIGCDGAHSTARHLMHIPFRGRKISETFLLVDVISKEQLNRPHFYSSAKGFCVILPFSSRGKHRIIFPLLSLNETPSPDKIKELLRERGMKEDFVISQIEWVSHFQIQRRIASRFIKKNVILAGDAAHIHSPIGGQGMNISIQDAFNLAWKLAMVITGTSDKKLLKSYEDERRPIAKKVLKSTSDATRFLTFSLKHWPSLFIFALKQLVKHENLRKRITENISELSNNYRNSPIVLDEASSDTGPKAGERMPDLTLSNGTRLYEILSSPMHHLLSFIDRPELINGIQNTNETWIKIHHIKTEASNIDRNLLYLIRPDGYIGYRGLTFTKETLQNLKY